MHRIATEFDETIMNIEKNMVEKKRKKRRYFETYISKVLKSISSKSGITSNSKQQLNSVIYIVAKNISDKVIKLTQFSKKKTLSDKEVINAVKLLFSGELCKNSIIEGNKSLKNFNNKKIKGTSRQGKAGIIFPPSIAEKFLRNFGYSKIMVSNSATIFLASVLEYLATEILILCVRSTEINKRVRITIRDLELSVKGDSEISNLFDKLNISFLGGGSMPFIHPFLSIKKSKKIYNDTNKKKSHRFRNGTIALREIKKYQNMSNCLTFPKFPFERIVRNIINNYNENMKISKDVFIILQYYIEHYIIDLFKKANLAAIHSGRVKLMLTDIEFICNIKNINTKLTINSDNFCSNNNNNNQVNISEIPLEYSKIITSDN